MSTPDISGIEESESIKITPFVELPKENVQNKQCTLKTSGMTSDLEKIVK